MGPNLTIVGSFLFLENLFLPMHFIFFGVFQNINKIYGVENIMLLCFSEVFLNDKVVYFLR
jgi:hypothetical protein